MSLRLVTEEIPGRGLAAVALAVAAGGDDDPPGRHGMAHLVEHLMFPRGDGNGGGPGDGDGGAGGEGPGFVALVQEAGGMCNAETHRDHTVFHTVVPADALADVLALEARRLLRFRPAPATVRSETAVIAEEIRAAGAGARLWDTVLAALHPGARHAYGTAAELTGVTAEEAETFFRAHHRRERAVLSVVGDVDAGRVANVVEREFGTCAPVLSTAAAGISRPSNPLRATHRTPAPHRSALGSAILYARDGVAVGHALADPRGDFRLYVAQVVLCELLGRSRLPQLVAEAAELDAAAVHCGYQGQWLASAAPDLALVLLGRVPGAAAEEAVARWLEVLGELAAAPPEETELRRAAGVLRAGCHRRSDSLPARAVTHARAALLLPHATPDALPAHLAAVTPADVSSAARALLAAPRTVHTLEGAA